MTVVRYTKLTSFVVPHWPIHPVIIQNFPKDNFKFDQVARFLVTRECVVPSPWVLFLPWSGLVLIMELPCPVNKYLQPLWRSHADLVTMINPGSSAE